MQIELTPTVKRALKIRTIDLRCLYDQSVCNRNFEPTSQYFQTIIQDHNELALILKELPLETPPKREEVLRSPKSNFREFENKKS